jgi:hypothetical protein
MDRFTEMPSHVKNMRERFLQEFPKEKHTDLNLLRIEKFISEQGLTAKPYVIFEKEDIPRIQEIEGGTNLLRSFYKKESVKGIYNPEAGLVFIIRDRELEQANGIIYTEGVLVHELAHGSSASQDYLVHKEGGIYSPRVGFGLPQNEKPWGWFLEEAWAESQKGEYIEKFASEEDRKKLEDKLNYGELNYSDTVAMQYEKGKYIPLPLKYLYIDSNGQPHYGDSALAGFALDILYKKHPELKKLMIEARESTEGLKQLARKLNSISPNLYKEIQLGGPDPREFVQKCLLIIDQVGGGKKNCIKAQGKLEKFWNNMSSQEKNPHPTQWGRRLRSLFDS